MPYKSYRDIVAEARNDDLIPSYEKCNALGQPGIPFDIRILGALRYLGRGWTFDDLFESTGVSEEIHRQFLKDFTVACRTYLYPKCPVKVLQLICPVKHSISVKESRWSRWAESMRKDVECTFDILKGIIQNLLKYYFILLY